MTFEIALTLLILLAAVILFISEQLRVDVIALLVLGTLAGGGLITPSEALSGFSNPAVVTVWAMFILGGALSRTGLANIIGRHLLPERKTAQANVPARAFSLPQNLFVIHLADDSPLAGKTLAESRLGLMLQINVIGIIRHRQRHMLLTPHTVLQAGDRLLVTGQLDRMQTLHDHHHLIIESTTLTTDSLASANIEIVEVALSPDSSLLGQTIEQIGFRHRFGANVLAVWRAGVPYRTRLQEIALKIGDILLLQIAQDQLERLRRLPDFLISEAAVSETYHLSERLLIVKVPESSALAGQTLRESRLGQAFGLQVLGITRNGRTQLMPFPDWYQSHNRHIILSCTLTSNPLSLSLNKILMQPKPRPWPNICAINSLF